MPLNPSTPLAALLVTAGFLAAGFAAEAGGIDQGLEGFVDVRADAYLSVTQVTGHGDGHAIEVLHLTVEAGTSAPVDLDHVQVHDEADRPLAILDVHPIRDEDSSLDEGLLDETDMARLVVDLAEPIERNEVHGLVLALADGEDTELVVETPTALDDGYTRLDHEQP